MKKIIYILLFCAILVRVNAQQDPQYSQYLFNQMVINPAYAGSRDALSVVVDARQQWSGFSGAPSTQSFSFHGPLSKKRIGLGFSGYADHIGPKQQVAAYGNVAYILPLSSKLKLSFGLRGGFVNYVFDWSKINYKDQGESNASYGSGSKTKFDMDAGLYLKGNSFYVGFSATHLNGVYVYKDKTNGVGLNYNQVYDLNYRLVPHLFLVAGKAFQVGNNLVINPTILFKSVPSTAGAMDLSLNFLIKQRIWVGVFSRTDQTLGLLTQVYVTDKLRIGYAFDRGMGKVQRNLGNGHEIMLGFDFNTFKSKMLSPRTL